MRDCLGQQIGAEKEAGADRSLVVLCGRERHGPGEIPHGEIRRRHEDEACRKAEPGPAPPGLAEEPRETYDEPGACEAERDRMGRADLLQAGR